MNKKLNWKQDRKNKSWYIIESEPYSNDGFSIDKREGFYFLDCGSRFIGGFNKLKSAKEVANLLRFG